jgi:PEGA domain-containing protein/protein kinase-like protein
VLHQIGIGALGPVFRTYEPTRDRLVAVKVFRLDIVPEQAQALATALGRAAGASLFHPSIVEPIAAGVEGTLAYRAEEYVAAESLDVAMRHYAPAPIEKVLPFITQLAGAIDFARAAAVGHGGLHPRDIFVTPDDARATGFGVIEALEEVGIRAPVRRPYTAPERIEGKPWSTPADIFSLAAITFELLTGRRPSGTGTLIGTLPAGESASLLHGVLARAMSDDPAQRYGSALAFAAALESAARGHAEAPEPAASHAPAASPAPPAKAVPVAAAPVAPPVDRQLDLTPSAEPPPAAPRPEPTQPASVAERVAQAEPAPAAERERTDRLERTSIIEREERAKRKEPRKPEPVERKELEPAEPAAPALSEPLLFDDVRGDSQPGVFVDEFALDETPKSADVHTDRAEPVMFESHEPSRPMMLPVAIAAILSLLAGFAGGYFVGSRDRLLPETTSASAATHDKAGQYSEQKVSPQATAPPATAAPATSVPATPAPTTPAPTAAAPTEPKTTEVPPVVQEGAPERGTPAHGAASSATAAHGAAPSGASGHAAAPTGTSAHAAAPPAGSTATRERPKPSGTIEVKSTPTHASVTINGTWRGRTPLTLEHLAFGHYVIRIVHPGYQTAREEFTLGTRDADHTFVAKLEPTATAARREPAAPKATPSTTPNGVYVGTLYVDSNPRGATVLLDGRKIGTTPISLAEVPVGSHVLRVELAGKRPWTSSTTIAAGQTARVTMSLEDKQ